jgi:aryl-alcohol dehydrogenase-like predicted oxidoreductase
MKNMKQRQLGKGGPMVGEMGFGAMSFGGIFGATDEATSHRALDVALDLGVTHIDTALIYGPHISEEVMGLQEKPLSKKTLFHRDQRRLPHQPTRHFQRSRVRARVPRRFPASFGR